MIQINLLPDVKQEFLRARRTRNVAISVSILAALGSGAVVVALLLILGVQAGREVLADNAIKDRYAQLQQVEDLPEMVTLQNQLGTIGAQHGDKTMDSRLFGLLQAINPSQPNDVQFTAVTLDPEASILRLEGIADNSYPAVETLKKTIDNTDVEYRAQDDNEVVTESLATRVTIGESSFGESADGDRVLRFEMTIEYQPALFTNEYSRARIIGPERRIDVTDSRIGVPDSLFADRVPDEDTEEDE